jgi:hypothetical protein
LDGYNYQEMPVDRTIIAWEVMAWHRSIFNLQAMRKAFVHILF